MRIETKEDFERARERLRRRGSGSLAAFVMSLAMEPGPVGEQVRTFIVGDDVRRDDGIDAAANQWTHGTFGV